MSDVFFRKEMDHVIEKCFEHKLKREKERNNRFRSQILYGQHSVSVPNHNGIKVTHVWIDELSGSNLYGSYKKSKNIMSLKSFLKRFK